MRGRRWDLKAFFETGRREISLLMYQLKQLEHLPTPGRAFDFGCGVGRLSQALAAHFADVVGVDISPTMIELAERLNRHRGTVRYVLNQSPLLAVLPSESFDFVYSDIVLQHLDPDAARQYVSEFLRVLAPGGTLVFQLPSHVRSADERPPRPSHMPLDAYQATVTAVDVPFSLSIGQTALATVDVQNCSTVDWKQDAFGMIRLGNHWRDRSGTLIIQDDGRTPLPREMPRGALLRLAVPIQAPQESGSFVCEFDLVHEAITWFADRGSTTARAVVLVKADDEAISGSLEDVRQVDADAQHEYPDIYSTLPPDHVEIVESFPMHGVPRETVLGLIQAGGGTTFHVEDDERGGPEWRGFRYFVSKPARSNPSAGPI
jgi:SAM-dependent methyltransferase